MDERQRRANIQLAVMNVVHGIHSTNPQVRITAMALLTDMATTFVDINMSIGPEYVGIIEPEFMPAILASQNWERN